jgi:hypothetical protein
MAAANALVMLGLLAEPRAEAILAEHRLALERKGFGNTWGVTKGELTLLPAPTGTGRHGPPGPQDCARRRCRWRLRACGAQPRLPRCVSSG